MIRPRPLLAALLALTALPAPAQEVQRCQGVDGKVSYANQACPDGAAAVRTLPPAGVPSAAEQQAARLRVEQDVRRAAALDRARAAEEDRAARERQQLLADARRQEAHCRRLQTGLRHAQEDLAAARSSKRMQMQRRLARAEDLYREDCGALRN
jgi:hypothetical protein